MSQMRRTTFGFIASLLLTLGLVKAAELFDPVFSDGRQPRPLGDFEETVA
jgi:hypothetical protein